MNSFTSKLEKILLPVAQKLNQNIYLAALRDGFVATMPIVIVGAFAIMLNSIFLDFSEGSLIATITGNPIDPNDYNAVVVILKTALGFVNQASIGIIGLLSAFTIASSIAESHGYKGLESGVIAVAALYASIIIDEGSLSASYLGSFNIISAIIIAMISGRVYIMFLNRNITIKMPEGVPPAVTRSFEALIPAGAILIVFGLVQSLLVYYSDIVSISDLIRTFVAAPLQNLAGGAFGMYIYATFIDVFWFFGINGGSALGFMDQTILTPASIVNAELISQGIIDAHGIIDQAAYDALPEGTEASIYSAALMNSYVRLGGGGATIGLIIAIFISSKQPAVRSIAKYSLAPGSFGINEPLMFGLPIIFNPILFIPFILSMPILLTTALIAVNLGIVPMYGIPIPWTAPPIVGAFLAYGGSFSAALFSLFQVCLSTVLYTPFVMVMNKARTENIYEQEPVKKGNS